MCPSTPPQADTARANPEHGGPLQRRVGINRAEHLRGQFGVAVPVMVDRQRACAAVAIQAPEGRMTLDELLAHVPRLREAAAAIGRMFGV